MLIKPLAGEIYSNVFKISHRSKPGCRCLDSLLLTCAAITQPANHHTDEYVSGYKRQQGFAFAASHVTVEMQAVLATRGFDVKANLKGGTHDVVTPQGSCVCVCVCVWLLLITCRGFTF